MFETILFCMTVASLVLHFVAPKTKTKMDDKAADAVDKAKELAPMVAPLFKKNEPAAAPGPFGAETRDHRK